jgi:hypothetical protein
MSRHPVDHALDSAQLGQLCREASAGLARLRSAFQYVVGRLGSMVLDETVHEVGLARVCSMVLVAEPEHFYAPDVEPAAGPESRTVPWVGTPKGADGPDHWHLLRLEAVETCARLDKLELAYRRDHPDVAARWAALAATVRKARLQADRAASKPTPAVEKRPRPRNFATMPKTK